MVLSADVLRVLGSRSLEIRMKKVELAIEDAEACLNLLRCLLKVVERLSVKRKAFTPPERSSPPFPTDALFELIDNLSYAIKKAKGQ